MRFQQLLLTLLLTGLVVLPNACDARRLGEDKDKDEPKPKEKGKLLAKVNLKDKSVVEFWEDEPGMIAITADLKGEGEKEFREKKADKDKKEKDDPKKLYERLTNKKVPKELEDAWERAKLRADDDPDKEEPTAEDLEEIGGDSSMDNVDSGRKLESDWWIDNYCTKTTPPHFCRCYTERTTNTQNEIYGFTTEVEDIDVFIDMYRGYGLQHNVYYWGCDSGDNFTYCTWKNFRSKYVLRTDSVSSSYIGSYNSRKFKWKFTVQYASGEAWHYSVSGDNGGTSDFDDTGYTCPNIY